MLIRQQPQSRQRALALLSALLLLLLLLPALVVPESVASSHAMCFLEGVLFPTGMDAQGQPAAAGAPEVHWTAYEPGPKALAAAPVVLDKTDKIAGAWLLDDSEEGHVTLSTRQWIAGSSTSASVYRFDHSFSLPADALPGSAKIDVAFAAGYAVVAVQLNGVSVWTAADPVLGVAPGTGATTVTLPALTAHRNTLSLVVLPLGPAQPAYVSMWFPVAVYESTTDTCGGSGASTRVLEAAEVKAGGGVTGLHTRMARGLFTQQSLRHKTNPAFQVLQKANTRMLQGTEGGSDCVLATLQPTSAASAWQGWSRASDGTTAGPWAPEVEADGWLSLATPQVGNQLFFETNFTVPEDAALDSVVVRGHHACELTLLGVYLNGKAVWVNPDPFTSAGSTSTPTPFVLKKDAEAEGETLWAHGTNVLGFAVLAYPSKGVFRTALQVTLESATYEGCAPPPAVLAPALEKPTTSSQACSAGCRLVGSVATADEEFYMTDMAVDAAGGLFYFTWAGETSLNLSRYSLAGIRATVAWPKEPLVAPTAVAVGPAGEVYVLDGDTIKGFAKTTGALLGQWGPLEEPVEKALAVLPFAGASGEDTWVFGLDGEMVVGWSTVTDEDVWFENCWSMGDDGTWCLVNPVDVAVSFNVSTEVGGGETPPPTVWVLDQGSKRVEMFDVQGKHLGGSEVGMHKPSALSVDSFRGLVYVLDEDLQEVVVLDRRGDFWYTINDNAEEDTCGFFRQRFFESTTTKGLAQPQALDQPVEMGLPFELARGGVLTAIRFYRAAEETGNHTATLWGAERQALATLAFPEGEKAGWQTVHLDVPAALEAETEYVVSINLNKVGTAILPFPAGAVDLDNGKDLMSLGGPVMSAVMGGFPTESIDEFFLDIEVQTPTPTLSLANVGTVAAVYTAADYLAVSSVFYVNHITEAEKQEVRALRCSGYPAFMGDCPSHLFELPPSVLGDVKAAMGSTKPVGVNFWGGQYALNASLDYLSEGVALAVEMGAESIGIYLGGELPAADLYPFHAAGWPEAAPASLTALAKLPYYQALFAHPQLKTYVINANAVTTLGVSMKLKFGTYSADDAAKEKAEFRELAAYLAATYKGTGKTFILQAWSLDTFLANTPKTELVPEWAARAATWLNARQAGVEAGRTDAGEAPASVAVYHSVQVSRGVLDKSQGKTTPWAIDRLLPLITPDLVGWSAYEATRKLDSATAIKAGMAALGAALRPSTQGYQLDGLHYPVAGSTSSKPRVYIAELGEPDLRFEGEPEASRMLLPGAIKAAVNANLPLVMYWSGYNGDLLQDEEDLPWTENHAGYWLKRPDGTPSFAMCYFQALQVE